MTYNDELIERYKIHISKDFQYYQWDICIGDENLMSETWHDSREEAMNAALEWVKTNLTMTSIR